MQKRFFPPAFVTLILMLAAVSVSPQAFAETPGGTVLPSGLYLSQAPAPPTVPPPAASPPEEEEEAPPESPAPSQPPAATTPQPPVAAESEKLLPPAPAAPAPQAPPTPKAVAPQPAPPPAVVRPPSPAPRLGRPPQPGPQQPRQVTPQPSPPVAVTPPAPPVAPGQPPAPPAVPAKPAPQVVAQPVVSGGKVALNFDDADVFSVIQTVFGEVLRVNYVIDQRVKGRVNFRSIAPVDRDKVLPVMEVILRLNGIGVVEESGLYRIVPISDISREPSPVGFGREPEKIQITGKALLQVIPIKYSQSGEVVKLITPFLSANAVVVDVPRSNHVIIVDTDASVKRIVEIVKILDSEDLRKRTKVHVYHVQNSKAKDIATLLQQIFLGAKPGTTTTTTPSRPATGTPSTPASTTPVTPAQPQITMIHGSGEGLISEHTKIIYDEGLNVLVIMASPEEYEIILETVRKVDIAPRQVVIEGIIAQVTLSDNLSLGIAGYFKAQIGNIDGKFGLNLSGLSTDPLSTSGFTFVGTDAAGAVRLLVNALASESKAKLLATPHIIVSDNKEARIQVGKSVPLVTSETYGAVGVAPQRIVQYKDIGVILKVKPRVNESGLVSIELTQEVSNYTTEKLYVDSTEIILNKAEATTSLVVQDGQTIVIGGLIREDTERTRTGLPFLIKLPILGWLFGNTDDTQARTELIILLSPHVIKDQTAAASVTSDYVESITKGKEKLIKKEELIKEKKAQPTGVPEGF